MTQALTIRHKWESEGRARCLLQSWERRACHPLHRREVLGRGHARKDSGAGAGRPRAAEPARHAGGRTGGRHGG